MKNPVSVVSPDPAWDYLTRHVVANVIIVQGLHRENFACLLTVEASAAETRRTPYALAMSLPSRVSGTDIAVAADLRQLCENNTCEFFFRWERIPFALPALHMDRDGYSYSYCHYSTG